MTIFRRSVLTPGLLFFVGWSVPGHAEDSSLRISASTPVISIKSRENDQRTLELPGLKYTVRFETHCGNGKTPRSILLSIADTRKTLSGNDLREPAEITIKISPGQIAPLSTKGFCLNLEAPGRNIARRITVYGVMSAQAALLCSDGDNEQLIYAAQALDLTLHCAEGADPRERE